MTSFEWITVALSALAVLALPALALVVRLTVRFTMLEQRIAGLADDSRTKERVHAEMYATMREDRAATDRRLRWLEENVWRQRGRGA